ncbi:excisionase [Streptomyces sp. NPDC013012]
MTCLKIGRFVFHDLRRTHCLASLTISRARRIPAHALTDYVRCQPEEAA